MGYQEVFEDDAARRKIYGVSPNESRSAWILVLDYLLEKVVDETHKNHLELLYAKYNLGAEIPQVPNVLDSNLVFWDVGEPTPTTGAEVLAMNQTTLVGGKFTLPTGDTETKFKVALPPVRTISKVEDITAGSLDITAQYPFIGTISVTISGTPYDYNYYEMTTGIAYSISHDHEITV
jgi:hypothetical protein